MIQVYCLLADDGTFGNKADSHLKEFQSFTDLLFSKEKTITCIDWHPTIKGKKTPKIQCCLLPLCIQGVWSMRDCIDIAVEMMQVAKNIA